MVVLDLSASISSDTFSRIGETLRGSPTRDGRYGLVVFSDVAYEALPPGTPASALRPLVRYFTLPSADAPGERADLPDQPVERAFSGGTRISAGLELAHRSCSRTTSARRGSCSSATWPTTPRTSSG